MAYSNYVGKVYKNGERIYEKEDVPVFEADGSIPELEYLVDHPEEVPKGAPMWWCKDHHAVLGEGRVRLCAHKTDPELWVWREGQLCPELIDVLTREESLSRSKITFNGIEKSGEVSLGDKVWKWRVKILIERITFIEVLSLTLIEPDGIMWKGEAYYSPWERMYG